MRKFNLISLCLAICIILSSCRSGNGSSSVLPDISVTPPEKVEKTGVIGTFDAHLYYLSLDKQSLLDYECKLDVTPGATPMDVMVKSLMTSPDEDLYATCIPSSIRYKNSVVSNGICSLYFSGSLSTYVAANVYLRAALAASFRDSLGFEAINVFLNNHALTYKNLYCGITYPSELPLSNYLDNINALYTQNFNSDPRAEVLTVNIPLYLPCSTSNLISATPVSLEYDPSQPLEKFITDILSDHSTAAAKCWDGGESVADVKLSKNRSNDTIATITYSTSNFDNDYTAFINSAALTLFSVISDINGFVFILSNGTYSFGCNGMLPVYHNDCIQYVADTTTLYYPNSDGMLSQYELHVPYKSNSDILFLLDLLFKNSSNALNFPELSTDDINYAYVSSGIAVIDCNASFVKKLSNYINDDSTVNTPDQRERLAVFSMVNMLTDISYINGVFVTLNGQRLPSFNLICFDKPLIRNFGIIA